MVRVLCCGCEKEIGLAEIPFCDDCLQLMDPDAARARELQHALGHLKGATDHIRNGAGACVSWCPVCHPARN